MLAIGKMNPESISVGRNDASMPAFLRGVTYFVPARYFLIALRGIVLKGVGVSILWQPLVTMSAYSAAVLILASVRLRRQWS